jgi:hypothetical protein
MQAEKAVPIPKRVFYGFDRMSIGDSFFFEELSEVERCASAAYSYAKTKQPEFKMTRRKVDGGYRIWRIR